MICLLLTLTPVYAQVVQSGNIVLDLSQVERTYIPVGPVSTDDEILSNTGFESGVMDPWYHDGFWSISTTSPHAGTYCAYDIGNHWLRQDFDPIPAASIVSATLWCRQPEAAIAAIDFFYTNGTYSEDLIWPTATWQQFNVTSFITTGLTVNGIRVWGYSGGGSLPDETFYDDFSIEGNVPTPVVLTAFNASIVAEGVNLTWSTASEIECHSWNIERNGELIATIEGHGTTAIPQNYNYLDEVGNGTYTYTLKQVDISGSVNIMGDVTVTVGAVTEFAFRGNYPNPFNPMTTISFSLPISANVTLNIYDISGKVVATVVNGWRSDGIHNVTFDASDLTSGVYICRLQAGDFTSSSKMVLMK